MGGDDVSGRLRTSPALVALAACVLLPACGVQPQDGASLVPAREVPQGLVPTGAAPPQPRATEVVLYVVDGGRLVRARAEAERADAESALLALLSHSSRGTSTTAVPPGTEVRGVLVQDGVLSIDLTEPFGLVRGPEQLLAVAQVVWTVTEFPDVRRVLLRVEGEPLDLPVDDGPVSDRPVDREDYRSIGPSDGPGRPR